MMTKEEVETLKLRMKDRVEIARRSALIKPIIDTSDGWHEIAPVDPVVIAYTWSPTPILKVHNIKPIASVITRHCYGYYGFFKPSIGECVMQIPDELLNEVDYFSIKGPEYAAELRFDGSPSEYFQGRCKEDFQLARMTLWKRTTQR